MPGSEARQGYMRHKFPHAEIEPQWRKHIRDVPAQGIELARAVDPSVKDGAPLLVEEPESADLDAEGRTAHSCQCLANFRDPRWVDIPQKAQCDVKVIGMIPVAVDARPRDSRQTNAGFRGNPERYEESGFRGHGVQ